MTISNIWLNNLHINIINNKNNIVLIIDNETLITNLQTCMKICSLKIWKKNLENLSVVSLFPFPLLFNNWPKRKQIKFKILKKKKKYLKVYHRLPENKSQFNYYSYHIWLSNNNKRIDWFSHITNSQKK